MTYSSATRATGALTAAGLLATAAFAPSFAQDTGELGEIVPPLTVVYYAADMGPVYEQSARVLSEEWAKLGLDLQLRPVQFSTFVATYMVGGGLEHIAVFTVGADPDRVDPTYYLYDIAACGQRRNGSKWCDEEYSAKAAAQRTEIDPEARLAAVHELQAHFQEELPWWPVTNTVYGILWNSDKWENVTNPSPVASHEALVDPWLAMRPKTDDRIVDWAYLEDISTYNPMAEEGGVGWMRFVFDTFAKNNSEGETVPWAAESWEFVEPTTVRIKLREDMTFHDGEPVTADDAVYTLATVITQQPPAMSSRISNLSGVEKVDDYTFDVQLKAPDASFVTTVLTYLFIVPEHIWSSIEGPAYEWDPVAANAVIGSGPFKFKTWRMNELHELETHTDHFHAPAYDGLRRLALGQSDAIRAAMLAGTADVATTVLPVAAMSDLAEQEDFLEFQEIPSHGTLMAWVNNEAAPFTDKAFRQALRMATSKRRAAVEGWLGFAVEAGEGNVPRQLVRWYNADLPEIPFDIEGARAILAEAGYGWDSDGRLHYPKQ